jgi:hypothetical protein
MNRGVRQPGHPASAVHTLEQPPGEVEYLLTQGLVYDEARPMRVAVRPGALDDGTLRDGCDLILVPM